MQKIKFRDRITIIGCGSVAQCALPLLFKLIDIPAENITVIDFVDNRPAVQEQLQAGVKYLIKRVTRENYREVLKEHAGAGDLIIDLAWNIDCTAMMQFCRDNQVMYINTSVEDWDPYKDEERNDPCRYTLYSRHQELRQMIDGWLDNNGPTTIVDHGANPGLVSHFTKRALLDIAARITKEKPSDPRRPAIEAAMAAKDFARLSRLAGVKVVQISERDTQISDRPKQVNEFVGTWSIEGLFEEGLAPVELGWGTHERLVPEGAFFYQTGPRNQICLNSIGMKTWARSWVPSGGITGMLIRHGESYGISDRLTVWESGQAVYRPTVYYVYCPCDATANSLHELEMRDYDLQPKQRIMKDEIIGGRDELGVLLLGHDFNGWWCGSLLDIHTARNLVPHQQATVIQVAISVVAAAVWAIKNPRRGFLLPDDVDHEEILELVLPYISPFVSRAVDWTPLKNLNTKFTKFDVPGPREEDQWQFVSFLADHKERTRVLAAQESGALAGR